MARIWWKPYSGSEPPPHPMALEWPLPESVARLDMPRSLQRRRVLFVRVAGFTFVFHSAEQLAAVLAFYRQKLHPSSQSPERAATVRSGRIGWRWHVQRWFERLPLYLREEAKRRRVVAALEAATRQAARDGFLSR